MTGVQTCALPIFYDFAGERLVVVARRLREGETAASFAALPVARSASPEMPAIWNQLYG